VSPLRLVTSTSVIRLTPDDEPSVIVVRPAGSVIKLSEVGVQGPPGPGGGAGGAYEHNQTSASDVWTVNHNLSQIPSSVSVILAGREVEADVVHVSANQLLVYLTSPLTGTVRVSP
jgi:hypothetical protein